jgi:uncharacterized protein
VARSNARARGRAPARRTARRSVHDPALQSSRYNFAIPVRGAVLLYNTGSGAVVRLAGPDAEPLAAGLSGPPRPVPVMGWPAALCEQLVTGEFLVPLGTDEVSPIRERYWRARRETPMTLTITTTMDCNLGCYYCYEERSDAGLREHDVPAIVALAEERLRASARRTLHVDWYGGEPLLNLAALEAGSHALQALCDRLGVTYGASIVSNGTAWPADVGAFVARHCLRQVQISFDGLAAHHDKRRRYRSGRAPETEASSFARAAALVDRLLDHARVDVRLNLDQGNRGDLLPFIAFMRERGWFGRRFPAVFQPARISAFSDRSKFLRPRELPGDVFETMRATARAAIDGRIALEESEVPDGFPFPRTSVCGALANDSTVIGADKALYRCGLQVGEQHRKVGHLGPVAAPALLPVLSSGSGAGAGDEDWWAEFDPTQLPTCRGCSFLPVCWAGCPKRHLDGDSHAIAEQGVYWRRNLPRLVAEGTGEILTYDLPLDLEAQFRDGPPVGTS